MNVAILLVGTLIVSGFVLSVSHLLLRRRQGLPALTFEPRRPVPWGMVDQIPVFIMVAPVVATIVLKLIGSYEEKPVTLDLAAIVTAIVIYLGVLAASLVGVFQREGVAWSDLGVVREAIARDVKIGAAAFCLFAPIVLTMQFLLTKYVTKSSHPIIEGLLRDASPGKLAACMVSAVIVAPVFEEYVFRVLFQGWLERLRVMPEQFVSRKAILMAGVVDGEVSETRGILWPSIVSAAIFALMHYSHGPDPIPLFFLALGLGYIYQQTHRILPCIIVHFLLNLTSMLILLIHILFGETLP